MSIHKDKVHKFHIPVMGLGFTIDTPFKVSHLGINSAVSVMEDALLEKMRAYYSRQYEREYTEITKKQFDYRAERIKAYTELMHDVTEWKFKEGLNGLCGSSQFERSYFGLLPDDSELSKVYDDYKMNPGDTEKLEKVRTLMRKGKIELNIMTKIDRPAYDSKGNMLDPEFSDAKSALRGLATSSADISILFSAGFNPGLYAYCEKFADFYPDAKGQLKKTIILKVSDFRSARIQGLFFAKKGIWVSEFRIESGLNCGGHTFISDGVLMGPVLQEFKDKKTQLADELFETCQNALRNKGFSQFSECPELLITAQGGIGNAEEHNLFIDYFKLDSCGWGSPFLLVPEVTNVDRDTLNQLVSAKQEDYYLSHSSPLGVPFNNFRKSSSEKQRLDRIQAGRPGSPCYKKFLSFNTEFTDKPICTASSRYQMKKIKSIRSEHGETELSNHLIEEVLVKDCLCEGLGSPALQNYNIEHEFGLKAVTICPGPNLAYFSGRFTLSEMCSHIYGRTNLLNSINRDHVFINELRLNLDYLKHHFKSHLPENNENQAFEKYKANLLKGVQYYRSLFESIKSYMKTSSSNFLKQLYLIESELSNLQYETL